MDQLVKLPSSEESGTSEEENSDLELEAELNVASNVAGESNDLNTVNLDVTAVFVLISSLTNGDGTKYQYSSKLLNSQAALEAKKPALLPLKRALQGTCVR